jgi:hypothetical protein
MSPPWTGSESLRICNLFIIWNIGCKRLAPPMHFPAAKVCMLLTAGQPVVSTYQVEVSGWDSCQEFFVQRCMLEWNEETGKRITLTRSLRPRTMIFVRLLRPTSSDPSFPVPYRTELTGVNSEGRNQFRLSQILPSTGLTKLSPS